MQKKGYVGFRCLGLVWIWFGFFFPLSVWHSCVSWHAMTLNLVLLSLQQYSQTRLRNSSGSHVPIGASQAIGVFSQLQT